MTDIQRDRSVLRPHIGGQGSFGVPRPRRLAPRPPHESVVTWAWFHDAEFREDWREYMYKNQWALSIYWRERVAVRRKRTRRK